MYADDLAVSATSPGCLKQFLDACLHDFKVCVQWGMRRLVPSLLLACAPCV